MKPWKVPACNKCRGHGDVDCCECGSRIDCDNCNGTGYDPHKIDVDRWAAESLKLTLETGKSSGIVEDGSIVGQTNGNRSLFVRDFALARGTETK